jgi:hypothetical protein
MPHGFSAPNIFVVSCTFFTPPKHTTHFTDMESLGLSLAFVIGTYGSKGCCPLYIMLDLFKFLSKLPPISVYCTTCIIQYSAQVHVTLAFMSQFTSEFMSRFLRFNLKKKNPARVCTSVNVSPKRTAREFEYIICRIVLSILFGALETRHCVLTKQGFDGCTHFFIAALNLLRFETSIL